MWGLTISVSHTVIAHVLSSLGLLLSSGWILHLQSIAHITFNSSCKWLLGISCPMLLIHVEVSSFGSHLLFTEPGLVEGCVAVGNKVGLFLHIVFKKIFMNDLELFMWLLKLLILWLLTLSSGDEKVKIFLSLFLD